MNTNLDLLFQAVKSLNKCDQPVDQEHINLLEYQIIALKQHLYEEYKHALKDYQTVEILEQNFYRIKDQSVDQTSEP